jgi:hypothetical protein
MVLPSLPGVPRQPTTIDRSYTQQIAARERVAFGEFVGETRR